MRAASLFSIFSLVLSTPCTLGFVRGPPVRSRPIPVARRTGAPQPLFMSSAPQETTTTQKYVVRPKKVIHRKEWVPVLHTIDLCMDDVIPIEANGQSLLIVTDANGDVHCTETQSPFLGVSLLDGEVRGDTIVCPVSGSSFNLQTGKLAGQWCPEPPVIGPAVMSNLCAKRDLVVHPLRVVGRTIEVYVDVNLSAAVDESQQDQGVWYSLLEALDRVLGDDI